MNQPITAKPPQKQLSDLQKGDYVAVRSCGGFLGRSVVARKMKTALNVLGDTYTLKGKHLQGPGIFFTIEVWDEERHTREFEAVKARELLSMALDMISLEAVGPTVEQAETVIDTMRSVGLLKASDRLKLVRDLRSDLKPGLKFQGIATRSDQVTTVPMSNDQSHMDHKGLRDVHVVPHDSDGNMDDQTVVIGQAETYAQAAALAIDKGYRILLENGGRDYRRLVNPDGLDAFGIPVAWD